MSCQSEKKKSCCIKTSISELSNYYKKTSKAKEEELKNFCYKVGIIHSFLMLCELLILFQCLKYFHVKDTSDVIFIILSIVGWVIGLGLYIFFHFLQRIYFDPYKSLKISYCFVIWGILIAIIIISVLSL